MGAVMRFRDHAGNAFAAAVVRGAVTLCTAFLPLAPGAADAANEQVTLVADGARPASWVQLDRGGFALGQFDGRFGDRSQRQVELPHAWETTDPGATGDGWYTFEWKLERVPMIAQGLCLTALTVPTEVYVNGDLVTATGPLDGRRPRSYEQSRFVEIPADSLRDGVNYVSLHLRARTSDVAGLGVVLAGDAEPLRQRAHRVLLVHTLAPAAIGIATFTVGIFIFALWLRRRDAGYALFAAAVILWSVHTLLTLLPEAPLPQPHWAILWTWMYLVFVSMLCLFCVRFAGVRWPVYERLVQVYAVVALPALYLSYALDSFEPFSSVARLGGIAMVLIALAAVARYSIRRWNLESALLLAAGTISAIFAAHDWLVAQNPTNLRPIWLVPYAALAFLTLFGYLLTDRFVRALNASERLNVDLERRVAEKSAALSAQLDVTRAARNAAEAANRAKSSFLAAASHDLRQPLHALGMFAQALTDRTRDAEGQHLAQRIATSVGALEALLSALLDVSKLDAGAIVANPRDFAIRSLFDRLIEEFTPEALERGLKLALVCGEPVIKSDPVLIERILRNLIANALRYTARGGVVIGCRRRGAGYALEVWDSGPGIPATQRTRIFEEFYQIGNPGRDRTRGLGLGLAIVRRLAELLGHRIEVQSREGRGSVFRIVVPAGDRAALVSEQVQTLPGPSLAGTRILIVDDEADVRDATTSVLRQWECDVVAVADVAAAMDAYGSRAAPEVMLVDYRLGSGADGLAAVAELRRVFGPATPAVLVSGESGELELGRIRESGVPLLHKPLPPARLRSLLVHLLQTASKTQETADLSAD
ncbi:MAG TPA: ATP-binding protein [Casimicrobiaceae bacterium]|nr:ATP-binding protein [Casimicrobiaceae bacterium]